MSKKDKQNHHKKVIKLLKSDTAKIVQDAAQDIALNLAVSSLQTLLIDYINQNDAIDQDEKTSDIAKLQEAFGRFSPASAKKNEIADFSLNIIKIVFNLDDHDILQDQDIDITEIIDDIQTIMNKKSTADEVSDAIQDLTNDFKELATEFTDAIQNHLTTAAPAPAPIEVSSQATEVDTAVLGETTFTVDSTHHS